MNSEFRIQNSETNGFGQFKQNGFQIIQSIVGPEQCDLFSAELTPLFDAQQNTTKKKIGGLRNLLGANDRVASFAKSEAMVSLLKIAAGRTVFPVRAIFFDKNPQANWLVPWHQDLAIAVKSRIETPGFTGWSVKDDTLHVHPPREILETMITLRLHLDDCNLNNGALKVIPRSHLHGKLSAEEISQFVAANHFSSCELAKGSALVMRPLILHASSPSENPTHRRVLHIEYATSELPNGLNWVDN